MLKSFESVIPFVKKLTNRTYTIDNWIFRLHYRVTFMIFLASTILVCSRQYIGEHIHCVSDKAVPERVMNTFCFFTSTFTLIKDYDAKMLDMGNLPHPGVGSYGINSKEEIRRHAYYQWVPFVLFGQGLMFYLTHILWKHLEGGKIKYLVDGLQLAAFSFENKNIKVSSHVIPSKKSKDEKLEVIKRAFIERLYISNSWSLRLILCECLNFINIILQVFITDQFLDGNFLHLGVDVLKEGLESNVDPLDEVFPKVTKCTFYKYGPSGSIQWHDAMCVMALNVVNDKIYIFLWFWFIILFICTSIGLLYRFLSILLHSRSTLFNKLAFSSSHPGKVKAWNVLTVTKYCSYSDWLFLKYISKNLDGLIFNDILKSLGEEMKGYETEPSEKSALKDTTSSGSETDYKYE